MTSNTSSNPPKHEPDCPYNYGHNCSCLPSTRPMTLRQQLKDDIEVLLRDYLRDNLDNWHTKPTPERIEEYLRFHMPGYTREAFAKLFDIYGQEIAREARLDELNRPINLSIDINFSGHYKNGFADAVDQIEEVKSRRIAELTQKPPQPQGADSHTDIGDTVSGNEADNLEVA